MDYPIKHPLDSQILIQYTCNLYRKSILPLMPIMVLTVLMYHFIILGQAFFPQEQAMMQLNIAMLLLVLIFPVIGSMITLTNKIAQGEHYTYQQVFINGFARLLSLFGALISILLIPLIVFGLCFGIYLLMSHYKLPYSASFVFSQLVPVIVFASFVNKLFAILLVYTDNNDANPAIDESATLVKGFYLRTFILSLYSVLIIALIQSLPNIITWYFPDMSALSIQTRQFIADVLLIILAPWSLCCFIVQLKDLQQRKMARAQK